MNHSDLPFLRIKKTPLLLMLLVALTLLLIGCASNPYAKYYYDFTNGAVAAKTPPPTIKIITSSIDKIDDQAKDLAKEGYINVGWSGFRGPRFADGTDPALLAQAKAKRASAVLFYCSHLGYRDAIMPIMSYQPGQTYTTTQNGTINAYATGSGGYASGTGIYSGTSTTTTPGTFNTQYVPYRMQIYQTVASFWRRPILGVETKFKDDHDGVYVHAINANSPASKADISVGDMLVKIGVREVKTVKDFLDAAAFYSGQSIAIELRRKGHLVTTTVKLN